MAKIKMSVTCPGCEAGGEMVTRKPKYFTPVITRFNCTKCFSRFLVSLEKGETPRQVKIDFNPIVLGATAIEHHRKLLEEKRLAEEAKKASNAQVQDEKQPEGDVAGEVSRANP